MTYMVAEGVPVTDNPDKIVMEFLRDNWGTGPVPLEDLSFGEDWEETGARYTIKPMIRKFTPSPKGIAQRYEVWDWTVEIEVDTNNQDEIHYPPQKTQLVMHITNLLKAAKIAQALAPQFQDIQVLDSEWLRNEDQKEVHAVFITVLFESWIYWEP